MSQGKDGMGTTQVVRADYRFRRPKNSQKDNRLSAHLEITCNELCLNNMFRYGAKRLFDILIMDDC